MTGQESEAQVKCREKGYKNCGENIKLKELYFNKPAPLTVENFSTTLVDNVYGKTVRRLQATSTGVTSALVIV